jgi:hypothetical protein
MTLRSRIATSLGAALAALLLGGAAARADQLPSYSYSWDQTPTSIASDGAGTGSISVSVGSGTAAGTSTIVAANLSAISSQAAPAADTYTNKAYTLTLSLTDTASGQSASMVFHGVLNGTMNTTAANLKNSWAGASTLNAALGGWNYSVHVLDPVLPEPAGGILQGTISALVKVTPAHAVDGSGGGGTGGNGGGPDGPASSANSPEPSALVLAGLALPLAAACRRRRRPGAAA